MLLITEEVIGERPYNRKKIEITWEECTLRKWLNNDFYNDTFTDGERKLIETTLLSNSGDTEDGIKEANGTKDKVFLLSAEEAEKYFTSDEDRKTGNWWWLRSFGSTQVGDSIGADGSINEFSNDVDLEVKLRPALWINL